MTRAFAASLLLLMGLATPTAAQDPPPKKDVPPKPGWPDLKPVRQSIARDKIPQLASKAEKARETAHKLLLSYGGGVCPLLLDAMHERASPELLDAIEALLDELVERKYAAALASHFNGGNERRNLYIVKRLRSFHDHDLQPFFVAAAKNPSPAVAEQASFALAHLGDPSALPFLFDLAKTQWAERNYEVREALPSLKGKAATDWLMRQLTDDDSHIKVAALRLLAGAGTKSAVPAIASYLDSREHLLRAETVNALRGIVDDEPPFRNLSVFQAIEEVKKWKQKLGRR